MPRHPKLKFEPSDLGNLEESLRMIDKQLSLVKEQADKGQISAAQREYFRRGVNNVKLEIFNALQTLKQAKATGIRGRKRAPPVALPGYTLESVMQNLPVGSPWYLEANTPEDMTKLQIRVKSRERNKLAETGQVFKTSTWVSVGAPIGSIKYLVRIEKIEEPKVSRSAAKGESDD